MSLKQFKGGIHPNEGKTLAKDIPLKRLEAGSEVAIPVSMHIGAPAKPVVAKGDHVLRGQLIAESGGFVSANIYSSVSGTVKTIEARNTATGGKVQTIIIENDGLYTDIEYPVYKPLEELSQEEILEAVKTAGVVGMGGAGFPTHVKLSPPDRDSIEFVIANCAECEPYITADYRRMLETPEKLVGGMKILLKLFPNAKGIFGVENNKPDCIEKLQALTENEERMEVQSMKTKYPQGAERQLIYAVTGRLLNADLLPSDVGAVVDNVETICAIFDAITEGKPVIERTITVSGEAIVSPGNFVAPIGMSHDEIIAAAGGFKQTPEKIISGGPMMGFAMFTTDVPMTKTTSSILAFLKDPLASDIQMPCISCGFCAQVCPGRIIPAKAAFYAENKDSENFVRWGGMECCGCGCCSYICPSKRPLKQILTNMRATVLAERKAARAAAAGK